MEVVPPGNVIDVRLEQSSNVRFSMDVILAGSVTEVKLAQSEKA